MSKTFSFTDASGKNAREAARAFGAVMEQRVIFYGGKFAEESAKDVLLVAQGIIDAETSGTGHLRDSGIVRKVGAGDTSTGRYAGKGEDIGASFTNTSTKTAYVISFNTMRVYKMKVWDGKSIKTRVRANRRINSSSALETITIEQRRTRTAIAHERGKGSLKRSFNYAIIVHEGDGTRLGIKFLERAYASKKEELREKFESHMREAFNIRYTSRL